MIYQPQLGLKASCAPQQLASRLAHQPQTFEFFTSEADFTPEGLSRLSQAIVNVKSSGVKKTVIHQPMKYQGRFCELVAHPSNNKDLVDFIDFSTQAILALADLHKCQVLIHATYELREPELLTPFSDLPAARTYLYSRMDHFLNLGGERIVFENGITPLFEFGPADLEAEILARAYPLAYNVSHAFITLSGDMAGLIKSLRRLKNQIKHYHLVDSMGQTHDSLILGQGAIDWQACLPELNCTASSIYEIVVKDVNNPQEQLDSHAYLSKVYEGMKRL